MAMSGPTNSTRSQVLSHPVTRACPNNNGVQLSPAQEITTEQVPWFTSCAECLTLSDAVSHLAPGSCPWPQAWESMEESRRQARRDNSTDDLELAMVHARRYNTSCPFFASFLTMVDRAGPTLTYSADVFSEPSWTVDLRTAMVDEHGLLLAEM